MELWELFECEFRFGGGWAWILCRDISNIFLTDEIFWSSEAAGRRSNQQSQIIVKL